jgi:hypothetical protein
VKSGFGRFFCVLFQLAALDMMKRMGERMETSAKSQTDHPSLEMWMESLGPLLHPLPLSDVQTEVSDVSAHVSSVDNEVRNIQGEADDADIQLRALDKEVEAAQRAVNKVEDSLSGLQDDHFANAMALYNRLLPEECPDLGEWKEALGRWLTNRHLETILRAFDEERWNDLHHEWNSVQPFARERLSEEKVLQRIDIVKHMTAKTKNKIEHFKKWTTPMFDQIREGIQRVSEHDQANFWNGLCSTGENWGRTEFEAIFHWLENTWGVSKKIPDEVQSKIFKHSSASVKEIAKRWESMRGLGGNLAILFQERFIEHAEKHLSQETNAQLKAEREVLSLKMRMEFMGLTLNDAQETKRKNVL